MRLKNSLVFSLLNYFPLEPPPTMSRKSSRLFLAAYSLSMVGKMIISLRSFICLFIKYLGKSIDVKVNMIIGNWFGF